MRTAKPRRPGRSVRRRAGGGDGEVSYLVPRVRFVTPAPTAVALNAVVRLAAPAKHSRCTRNPTPPAANGARPFESVPARTCAGVGAGRA